MDMNQIRAKGAIVTGAGSGINLAFAQALHGAGCSVLIMDVALHKDAVTWLDTLASTPSEAKVIFHKADVSDWSELERVFDVYAAEFGGVPYIVCPGAGIYEPSHPSFWNDADALSNHYRVLDINLLSPIKLTRIAIRHMLSHNQPGIIICVSSIGAQKASIVTPLYQASKHGISAFVRCMADLHALAGIRVVGVAPGIIRTPLYADHADTAGKFVDVQRDFMLEPDEVARGMMAVCLNGAKYAPGTILEVTDVGEETWREVKLLNDPGPQGRAILASRKGDAVEGVKAWIERDGRAKI